MEVSSVDVEDPYDVYKAIDPVLQSWEKVGRAALIGFSVMAVCAFIPAFKKKRVYSPTPFAPISAPVEVADMPEGPKPQHPAPHCTAEEQRKVEDILGTTAKGGFTLVKAGFRLRRLGGEIDHIHPFSFLLAAPKDSIRKIFHEGGSLVQSEVMGGIIKGMEREYARRNLERYAASFATEMGKAPERVKLFIRTRNWEGLVKHLFDLTHN